MAEKSIDIMFINRQLYAPTFLMKDRDFNRMDVLILGSVIGTTYNKAVYDFSNTEISKLFQVSTSTISRSISKLKKLGLIESKNVKPRIIELTKECWRPFLKGLKHQIEYENK